MLDTLHRFVSVWLLFNQNSVCLHGPLFSTKVGLESLKKTVGVLRRNTGNVPLVNNTSPRIDETHGKVLYTNVYTQDHRHPFNKDVETFKFNE